jgi:phage tail-like protein
MATTESTTNRRGSAATSDGAGPEVGSRYLDYLPAVFQQDARPGEPNWLGRFLRGFEAILTGVGDPAAPGLEELLDGVPDIGAGSLRGIERTFEPGAGLPPEDRAPDGFLAWLSQWVALSLRADVDEERQRVLIANAVRLYRLRGTKRGLEELVSLYTTLGATIDEASPRMQIGVHSTVGVDTWVDGGPPHYFRVTIRLTTTQPEEIAARRRVLTSIIDAEKPAHTYYTLDVQTPILQIGVTSRVGVDTLLGGAP